MTPADFSGLGEEVLALDIPDEIVAPFEWHEEGASYTYRAFLVPADVLNRYAIQDV